MYLGPSPNLFIIQAIALAAVTIKLARENLFNGVLFAAGASIFTAIAYLVPVPKLFIEGFSAILGPFISTLLSTVIEFFAFGLAIGASTQPWRGSGARRASRPLTGSLGRTLRLSSQ